MNNIEAQRNTSDRESDQNGVDQNEVILSRELQVVVTRLKSALPFLGLLFAFFLLQHVLKLTFFIGSAGVLYRISNGLREQIALKSMCNSRILFGLLVVSLLLLLSIFFSMSIFGDDKLWLRLVLLRKDNPNLGLLDILWFASVTDLAMRTAITAVKLAVCIWLPSSMGRHQTDKMNISHHYSPPVRSRLLGMEDSTISVNNSYDMENGHSTETRNRRRENPSGNSSSSTNTRINGNNTIPPDDIVSDDSTPPDHTGEISSYLRKKRCCAIIDAIGIIWRSILPVPLWLNYFVQGIGSEIFPIVYLCLKMMTGSWQAKALLELLGNFIFGKLEYGHYSTSEEIITSGTGDCSICFDKLHRPVTMTCRHIFCEHCIYEWLDRERTCPVCRAEVKEETISAAFRDGDSAASFPLII
eukprot:gene11321-23691_t